MLAINLILDGDGSMPDLAEVMAAGKLIHMNGETGMHMTGLSGGTDSGNPSVMFRFDLPDGRVLVAETSLRLLTTCVAALNARHGGSRWAN